MESDTYSAEKHGDGKAERTTTEVIEVNASGHVQELDRHFGLLSIIGTGVTVGAAWPAVGGSIVISIYNGGPPGVLYEFVAVCLCYCFIAACIAELASSIPSSAGVYHWASVTSGPRYGKAVGWFAGWWNFFAWLFGAASMAAIIGNVVMAMWGLFHPDFVVHRWHVFVVYVVASWTCCGTVLFANALLPRINTFGMVLLVGGVLATILVCAIMPSKTGTGYATNEFVWSDWVNQTGWSSNGFVFVAGMLNGAYAIGTPDAITHISEEIDNPRVGIPRAIAAQLAIGFATSFVYLVAILYSITSLDNVLQSTFSFPLASVYYQATNSRGGAMALLLILLLPIWCTCVGTFITSGRMLWTLARDDATPFSGFVGRVSNVWKNPFNATLVCGILVTLLGCIFLANATAFQAFVGSFVVLTTASYVAAILPNLLTRRRYINPGPFYMKGVVGQVVYGVAAVYIVVFIVIFCLPYSMPVTGQNMNYSSVISGGLTVASGILWLYKRNRGYQGPRVLLAGTESGLEPGGSRVSMVSSQAG